MYFPLMCKQHVCKVTTTNSFLKVYVVIVFLPCLSHINQSNVLLWIHVHLTSNFPYARSYISHSTFDYVFFIFISSKSSPCILSIYYVVLHLYHLSIYTHSYITTFPYTLIVLHVYTSSHFLPNYANPLDFMHNNIISNFLRELKFMDCHVTPP